MARGRAYTVLPQVHFAAYAADLYLLSVVFGLYARGDREVRGYKGRGARREEIASMRTVEKGRFRPRSRQS